MQFLSILSLDKCHETLKTHHTPPTSNLLFLVTQLVVNGWFVGYVPLSAVDLAPKWQPGRFWFVICQLCRTFWWLWSSLHISAVCTATVERGNMQTNSILTLSGEGCATHVLPEKTQHQLLLHYLPTIGKATGKCIFSDRPIIKQTLWMTLSPKVYVMSWCQIIMAHPSWLANSKL